ncbi:MAG: Uncharacterized protein G01um101448_493 [Parcubacteria group bacterium Gr01-1014_48]|nr:MAG: Uncharacterized protein Greene041614_812 [Parcubacteria group bacterium Greene0416_14]TSC73850.1 MAG: Uncharacterized protein G01um101448_493 [Parcubacteria group bacterium Gr01-1014_48]TSD00403.1 MAG: Uncharacterized protein Greene101415_861 [Parcubacteria group bacterium Greene1014_15]TSD07731.1 MAG: Uncharacterized protein Greene07144_763 [Parcubacteria group bacterium Greene0714_4]
MHAKRLFFLAFFVLFAGIFLLFLVLGDHTVVPFQQMSTSSSTREKIAVLMQKDTFEPEELQIKKGTAVIFRNSDIEARWPASNLHPTHGIYPEFDPQTPISPGESWTFIFKKKGKWRYHDHLIPNIRGTIVVE